MPLRVQRIEEFVKHVEAGDLKLRVRVLEVGKFFNLHILWYINFLLCVHVNEIRIVLLHILLIALLHILMLFMYKFLTCSAFFLCKK
jgi:hypothetical protein